MAYAKKGAKTENEHLLHWLKTDSLAATKLQNAESTDWEVQGFGARLFQLCLHALQYLCREKADNGRSPSHARTLRECVARLCLWGDSFDGEQLDKALDQSDDLRDVVLEHLCHIGTLVLRGKEVRHPETMTSSLSGH